MSESSSRRNFVATAGAALAASPLILNAQQSPNNKLRVGWIATGSRGQFVMKEMYRLSKDLVEVTHVCDTYQGNLAKGKDIVQTMGTNTPKTSVDYRDLINDPNVDVIFISSPEHLHYPMAMAALKAKKNIYLEKPIAHTLEEGQQIVDLAEKTGTVVQVGTQNRSNKLYIEAKKMVEDGVIGDIHYVRAFWYRNFKEGEPTPAAWRYPIPADTTTENTDWKRFLEHAEHQNIAFDKNRYFQWRNYWDYSSGISTDLLVHQTDISNFVVGKVVKAELPTSCMASGGIYAWYENDDREVPDTLSAIYEYPNRFHLNYSCFFGNDNYGYGEQFMGYKGTIEVMDRHKLHFYPQRKFGPKTAPPLTTAKEIHLDYLEDFKQPDATADHVRNFLMACLGKEKAIAPARAGQIAAIPGHMATTSYKKKRAVFWDAKTSKITVS